jgi:hypothetical protein
VIATARLEMHTSPVHFSAHSDASSIASPFLSRGMALGPLARRTGALPAHTWHPFPRCRVGPSRCPHAGQVGRHFSASPALRVGSGCNPADGAPRSSTVPGVARHLWSRVAMGTALPALLVPPCHGGKRGVALCFARGGKGRYVPASSEGSGPTSLASISTLSRRWLRRACPFRESRAPREGSRLSLFQRWLFPEKEKPPAGHCAPIAARTSQPTGGSC